MTEKVWTMLSPKFGKDAKQTTVIIRVLHGLKLAGVALRSHLASCMESLGCEAYLDLWSKPEMRPEDWVQY